MGTDQINVGWVRRTGRRLKRNGRRYSKSVPRRLPMLWRVTVRVSTRPQGFPERGLHIAAIICIHKIALAVAPAAPFSTTSAIFNVLVLHILPPTITITSITIKYAYFKEIPL
jgi:hypothetical protein